MLLPENNLAKYNSRYGFTFIELMIAIVITGILFGTGVVRYIDFNKTQTVKAGGQTFKNNLRYIQSKALSGVKPTSGCVNLDGYRVTVSSTTTYATQAVCGGVLTGSITTYSLPAGLFLIAPGVSTNFNFKILGTGASVTTRFIISNSVGSPTKWYGVCVSTSGDIKDCGYSNTGAPVCAC